MKIGKIYPKPNFINYLRILGHNGIYKRFPCPRMWLRSDNDPKDTHQSLDRKSRQ